MMKPTGGIGFSCCVNAGIPVFCLFRLLPYGEAAVFIDRQRMLLLSETGIMGQTGRSSDSSIPVMQDVIFIEGGTNG